MYCTGVWGVGGVAGQEGRMCASQTKCLLQRAIFLKLKVITSQHFYNTV